MSTQNVPRPTPLARELLRSFRGPIHLPGTPSYDAGRATWSGAVDPRPAIVAEASGVSDIRVAVELAAQHRVPFATQSTGHGTYEPTGGGVLVKTGSLNQVVIDPASRVAVVGPGTRWNEVIAAAEPFGLAPLSGTAASVGVTGYTLGGGVGWLARLHGFAADSLVRAGVVTADGRYVIASREEHPDLFWALRGAGANFGVVTWLEFRLYPVSTVFAGTALHPVERAPEALAFYGEWAPRQPRELTTTLTVLKRSPWEGVSGPVLAVRAAYAGPSADALRALDPLRRVLGTPLADDLRPGTYAETGRLGGTPPLGFELLPSLTDAVVETLCDPESAMEAVEVRHWGGAMAEPAADAGPVGHRSVPYSATVLGSPASVAPLAAYATGGSFLNFLHDQARTQHAYTGEDYLRLREVKRTHDPDNVFGRTHNIPPTGSHTGISRQ